MAVNLFSLRDVVSIKADVLLAYITQHIGFIITSKLVNFEHPLSLKNFWYKTFFNYNNYQFYLISRVSLSFAFFLSVFVINSL